MNKEKLIDTKITEDWGVKWSAMEVVRDFLQNFYDDNDIADIKVDIKNNKVSVTAPAEFDYQLLLYLKSTKKNTDKIGKYGEGFKASVLNAIRDYGCEVEFIVKNKKLSFFFKDKSINNETTRVLMCKVKELKIKIKGSKLILNKCSDDILKQFKFGFDFFYHSENNLLGSLLESSIEDDIKVYKSKLKSGYVFYKNLLRGNINVPIILICNRKYEIIDKKIEHDRDRKAFDEKVQNSLIKLAMRNIHHRDKILSFLESWWAKENSFLSNFAQSVPYHEEKDFDGKYFCHTRKSDKGDPMLLLAIEKKEKKLIKGGWVKCPSYMRHFGMKDVESILESEREDFINQNKDKFDRSPSSIEEKALGVLIEFISQTDEFLANKFSYATYKLGDSEEILGELRDKSIGLGHTVYLSTKVFNMSFGQGLGLLLHEWNHIYGYDGDRSFSDALTESMMTIIDNKELIDLYQKDWVKECQKVQKENQIELANPAAELIKKLSLKSKNKILEAIPIKELKKLIRNHESS